MLAMVSVALFTPHVTPARMMGKTKLGDRIKCKGWRLVDRDCEDTRRQDRVWSVYASEKSGEIPSLRVDVERFVLIGVYTKRWVDGTC
jgi:hypothetical protein